MTTTKAKAARMLQHPDGRDGERLRTLSASHPITGNQRMSTKILKGKSYMRGLMVNIGNAC